MAAADTCHIVIEPVNKDGNTPAKYCPHMMWRVRFDHSHLARLRSGERCPLIAPQNIFFSNKTYGIRAGLTVQGRHLPPLWLVTCQTRGLQRQKFDGSPHVKLSLMAGPGRNRPASAIDLMSVILFPSVLEREEFAPAIKALDDTLPAAIAEHRSSAKRKREEADKGEAAALALEQEGARLAALRGANAASFAARFPAAVKA